MSINANNLNVFQCFQEESSIGGENDSSNVELSNSLIEATSSLLVVDDTSLQLSTNQRNKKIKLE